jgi:hypothetical protein
VIYLLSSMCNKRTSWTAMLIAGGIIAILIYLILTLVAFLQYPGAYGPITNWLSDLGNPQANPSGAFVYNLGCILTSSVLIIFYIGLRQWNTGDRKMRILLTIAQVAGILASFSLILAAIFPLGAHTSIHSFWSKMVFVFLGFFLTFSATALMKHPAFVRCIAYYAFFTALVNFVYGAILHSVFVAEWVSIGMFIIYVVMIAYNSKSLATNSQRIS